MLTPLYEILVDTDREKRLRVNVLGHGGRIEIWWVRGQMDRPLYDTQFTDDSGRSSAGILPMIDALAIVARILEVLEAAPPWHVPLRSLLPTPY